MFDGTNIRTVTIKANSAITESFNVAGTLAAIVMPATWTAASIGFSCSVDEVTWNPLYDSGGNRLKVTVAASRYVVLNWDTFQGVRFIKLQSVDGGFADVIQPDDKILTVVYRRI